MADVTGSISKMQVEELDQLSANSEAVQTKIGANLNALISNFTDWDIITSSTNWVAPANVNEILAIGIGAGGGGGEGGGPVNSLLNSNAASNGASGNPGSNTTFDGTIVGHGGEGGLGGGYFKLQAAAGVTYSGNVNQQENGLTLNGTHYGYGGQGGGGNGKYASSATPAESIIGFSANHGRAGSIGVLSRTVTPGNSYAVSIPGSTLGGDGNTTGGGGSGGGAGVLIVLYHKR